MAVRYWNCRDIKEVPFVSSSIVPDTESVLACAEVMRALNGKRVKASEDISFFILIPSGCTLFINTTTIALVFYELATGTYAGCCILIIKQPMKYVRLARGISMGHLTLSSMQNCVIKTI